MMIRRTLAVLVFVSTLIIIASAEDKHTTSSLPSPEGQIDVKGIIEDAFEQMSGIRYMRSGRTFEAEIGGKIVRGAKEVFLRKRTASEIFKSGLSSGCGDYCVVFIDLLQRHHLKTLYIDSAQLSIASLITNFSGHAVVAVLDDDNSKWFLVDPTAKQIISDNWSPKEKIILGQYWIGFQGSLEEYPVHGPEDLKAFYKQTLKSVPANVWSQHLVGLRFVVDESLIAGDGSFVNPNIPDLLETIPKLFREYGIQPEQWVEVTLIKGSTGPKSSMHFSEENGWVCHVGTESLAGVGLISSMEVKVRSHLQE